MGSLPTFTDVLLSSSDARLPPPSLLPTLIRLGLLAAFTVALNDRCNVLGGEAGGELAIAGRLREFRTKRNGEGYVGSAVRFGLLAVGHVAAAAPRRLMVRMVNGCWLWRRGDDVMRADRVWDQ